MPPRPPVQRVNLASGPSLQIDEDLINEALAAIERRAEDRATAPQPPRAEGRAKDGKAQDGADDDVLIDLAEVEPADETGAGGEVTIEPLSDDLVVAIDLEEPEPSRGAAGPSAAAAPPRRGERAPLFSIPEDLVEDDSSSLARAPAEEEERTDPAGIRPVRPGDPAGARPLTADPVWLDRVARLRKKSRALQARLTHATAELEQEKQAHHAARARARFADIARQDAEEQRDGLDRFARGLRTRILALEEEVARLQRRTIAEGAQSRQAAAESTLRELLPVLDNLQLALTHISTDLDRFVPGVQMVASQFLRCLDRLGVERIDASPGTRFDPAIHEAILTLPAEGIPEGHVFEEVRSGYTLKTRLLRAAQVSVAGPNPRAAERTLPKAADDALPHAAAGALPHAAAGGEE